MNLLDSVLILLLVGAFILLIAVFFLIWFAKYNEKPSTFFLPAVLPAVCESAPKTLELEEEIFESKQLRISQPIPATQEKSQSKKSTPRNFEKKLYYIESEI